MIDWNAMSNNEHGAHAPDPALERLYTESNFWQKILRFAKSAGREVIEKALWLHYAAQNPATPLWAKATIYGALGYFISPVDAIPDLLPMLGYSDDLGVLAAAVVTVSMYITQEVKAQASAKLHSWFK